MMVVLSYLLYTDRKGSIAEKGRRVEGGSLVRSLLFIFCFIAGVLSSTFGIGGGLIFVPVFVLLVGKGLKEAIAMSMFVIAFITVFRITFVSHEGLDLVITLSLVLGALIGGQVGSGLMRRMRSKHLFYVLEACIFFIAIHMGARAVLSLI